MRLLISHSSDCRSSVEAPASVAESIASISTMIVAKSALQPQQNFSVVPGRSNDASIRPQILHCEIDSSSVPLGPDNIRALTVLECRTAHCLDRAGERSHCSYGDPGARRQSRITLNGLGPDRTPVDHHPHTGNYSRSKSGAFYLETMRTKTPSHMLLALNRQAAQAIA